MKRLPQIFAAVAGSALFAMMVLTFADIVGRKFLDNSIPGAVELTELFMLVMIFFALLDRLLPPALLRWQQALANVVTAAAFGAGAWIVQQRAQRTEEFGDMTSVLEIKLAPFHEMVAVMLLLTALAHAVLAVRALRRSEGRA
jgi:TRAP-type transport system small permease protein